jgi:hypothetical protein
LLENEAAAAARGHSPLARLVEHREERGEAPPEWRAPSQARAALVLAPTDDSLGKLVQTSSWAGTRHFDVTRYGASHEALSGAALALGALLVARGIPEVLVVAGGRGVRFVTRFEALERSA